METRVEHNGYMITQPSAKSIMVYKDGRFFLHASVSEFMEEEELIATFDELLEIVSDTKNQKGVRFEDL